MAEPVVIQFQAGGVADVLSAFRTVQGALADIGKATNRQANNNERTERDSANKRKQTANDLEAYKLRVQANSAKMAGKYAAQLVNDERAAEEKKKRAVEDAEAYKTRIRQNSAKMAGQIVEQQVRSEISARQRMARAIGTTTGNAVRRSLGAVTSIGGGILALGGGISAVDALRGEIGVRGMSKDIELRSQKAIKADDIRRIAATAGTQYGYSTEDVLSTANEFVKKSGAGGAVGALVPQMVQLASASGASLGDIGTMTAKFQMLTGNTGQTMDLMRNLIGAGRAGSIDISDLGEYGGRIAGASAKFQDKIGAAKFFTGMMQQTAATGGATDAAEASESIAKFAETLEKRRDDIKGVLGHNVYDKAGVMLGDPKQLVLEMLRKTGGREGGISNIFEDIRAKKAVAGYENIYRRGFEEAGGHAGVANPKAADAAIKAVLDAMAVYEKSAVTEAQVREEAAERANQIDRKIQSAMNNFHTAIGEKLIPVLMPLIDKFALMVPKLAELLSWLVSNPWKGLGALVAGSITKDLADAGIGAAVRIAIQALLTGNAVGTAGAAGGGMIGKAAVALGAGGLVGLGAAAVATAGTVSSSSTGVEKGTEVVAGMTRDINSFWQGVISGKVSPDEARAKIAEMQGVIATAKDQAGAGGAFVAGASAPFSMLNMSLLGMGNPSENVSNYNQQSVIVDASDQLQKAIAKLKMAAEDAEYATKGISNINSTMSDRSGPYK